MTSLNVYTLGPAIAVLLNFGLVGWAYYAGPPGMVRRTFIRWTVWMGLWNAAVGIGYLLPDASTALAWYKFIGAPIARFTAPIFLHFVAALTETLSQRRTQKILKLSYALAAVLVVVGCATSFLMQDVKHYYWGYYPLAGKGDWVYGCYFTSVAGYAFALLWKSLRGTHGDRRNQLLYVFAGAAVGFVSGFTNFLPMYGWSIYPVGNLMNSLYSALVAYAIVEYGLLDIQLILRRGTVYGILTGALTAVYLSIVAVLQRMFGQHGIQEHVAFYTAAFPLTVILAPTMKARIEPFVDHTLFGDRWHEASEEDSQKKNQEMALMGLLASEMAHELTKPLTHIMNAGSRLGNNAKGDSRENVRTIEKEVQRASEILDGFSMLSPDRTLHRMAIPLAELVEESLVTLGLREDRTIRIIRDFEALSPIPVNPGQIVQVLTNLIQNAWHAMPEGGVLTLTIRGVRADRGRSAVEVSIADTGHGIPVEIQKKVFKPFFTTKVGRGGRGMGLPISRAMVERHGGTITIHSPTTSKGGTRVTVHLPILAQEGPA